MPAALDGIRVLDFTQMMLGPYATQLLADLGADVIKIERPEGEWERGLEMMGELIDGDSACFLAMNRNKRSVALDLKSELAQDALLRLAATCDVLVENFRPGVLDRLGLGYEDVKKVKPDIIYCSGTGWGRDTVFAKEGRPGQDLLIQAMSGLAANGGTRQQAPTPAGTSIVDASTALTLSNGILAALVARERQGIGQRVEVDLFSTAISLQCQEISALVNQRQEWQRSETGVGQPWLSAPFGIYQAADGHVAIAMAPVARVAELLGAPDLTDKDPWSDRDEVKETLEQHTRDRTADDLIELLMPAGIWCARVRSTKEAVDELRDQGSDLIVTVDHPQHGTLELIGCPIRLSETPWDLRYAPPTTGQHTADVLGEILDDRELAALVETR
ncbi:CaiB/BaiF CoA transferase family protein [Microlunatus soli]|uniref:Crotonobetainyl-CoA:carnitine CoA-transferase CaiB n=1 Tax=Microlunatus soli TaxID=630515 RepID=A0A1H1U1E9_9ACTN|nr:CoA transferase [Microlunatus soli]SDS66267.1 Crotonobetainyl-CoA:carnitine CoA-transferase CaiB [Microlunatus soli]